MRLLDEKEDITKIIKDLETINFSKSNEEQGKFSQIMKGMAFSEDPKSNEFMKKLNKAVNSIAKGEKEKSNKKESIVVKGNGTLLDINEEYSVELEEGKEYIIQENK